MRGADRLLIVVCTLAGAGALSCALLGVRAIMDNRTIEALATNHDVPVSASATEEVVFARAHFLLRLDRLDDAQVWIDEANVFMVPSRRAHLFYNLANARLRTAFVLIQRGEIDAATAHVRLAKEGYRRALTIDPEYWDAKYNLDIAMRLVRDFPQMASEVLDVAPGELPKRLWTDLPRQPRGLP